MRLLFATLALMSTAAKPAPPKIDVERMIEAVCQIEGGEWNKPGGRGCIGYAAWSQHSHYAFQLSANREYAIPVYLKHIEWIIKFLPVHGINVTPASVYLAWRRGLEGAVLLLKHGAMPEQAVRCENLYSTLTPPPPQSSAESDACARD